MKQQPSLSVFLLGVCAASAAQAASTCTPGFYDPAGGSACVPAPPGSFVPAAGATAPTLAQPGTYVPIAGASAPLQAPAGRFVSAAGATTASAAQPGYYVAGPGASEQTQAPPGTFVDVFEATAPTPAPPGRYVPAAGATTALLAQPGQFVPNPGASAPTVAPPGTYVAVAGATGATPADPGFFVPAAGATAAIPAPLGSYVPTPGASAPTLAPPGTYVAFTGSTAPTPAPAGTYVAASGATAATPAPLGTYVATTGATAPTLAKPGFYTAAPGATAPIGAGMLASGANAAVLATRQILDAAPVFAPGSALGISVLGGRATFDQEGLTGATRQSARSNGLVLHAGAGAHRFFAGWSEQRLEPLAAGQARGEGWLAGWSANVVRAASASLHLGVFGGRSRTDGTREVSELAVAEQHRFAAEVRVLGVQLGGSLPLPVLPGNAQLALQAAAVQYRQPAFSETPSAAGTVAGLSVAGATLTTAPLRAGVRHAWSAVEFEWGLRADLNGGKNLRASLTNGQSFSFDVPLAQSSSKAAFVRLGLAGVELAPGLVLRGGVGHEAGSGARDTSVQVSLQKRW